MSLTLETARVVDSSLTRASNLADLPDLSAARANIGQAETVISEASLANLQAFVVNNIDPAYETIRVVLSSVFPAVTNSTLAMQFGMGNIFWSATGMYFNRHTLATAEAAGVSSYNAPQDTFANLGGGMDPAGSFIDLDLRIYRHPNNPGRPMTWEGHGPFRNTSTVLGMVYLGGFCNALRNIGDVMNRVIFLWDSGALFQSGKITVIGCR